MTVILLRDAAITLEDADGVPVDLRAGLIGGRLDVGGQAGEYFTLESPWAKYAAGGRRARLTLDILAETGAGSAHGLLREWLLSGGARVITITQSIGTETLTCSGAFRLVALRSLARAHFAGGEPGRVTAYLVLDGVLNITP